MEKDGLPAEARWHESVSYTARGLARYQIALQHTRLNRARTITDTSPQAAAARASVQIKAWDDEWRQKTAFQAGVERAALRTHEAQKALQILRGLLHSSLTVNHKVNWDSMIVPFSEPRPMAPRPARLFPEREPTRPEAAPLPAKPEKPTAKLREPNRRDPKYDPGTTASTLDALVPRRWRARKAAAERCFQEDVRAWMAERTWIDNYLQVWETEVARSRALHSQQLAAYELAHAEWLRRRSEHDVSEVLRLERAEAKHKAALSEWRERGNQHMQAEKQRLDGIKTLIASLHPDAVEDHFRLVLECSDYPECIPRDFNLGYNPQTQTLVVEQRFPAPEELPTLKEAVWAKTKQECVEKHLAAREANDLYDDVLYQVCLRTIHEALDADEFDCIAAVVFNGYVKGVDRGTGREITSYILSIHVTTAEFLALDLSKVEPRACFKTLKGVGSSKLYGLAPIAPVLRLNREDARFIEGKEVIAAMNEATNLAAMDWEDFEHLIRELFEAEFAGRGGEVKVTQASRDRGVDAVVFDPDPVSGGKIILQAKRYTNTVGVEAVRDLYGTVISEGANKGILITTADYGPEAYTFAKNLPITLLSGGNLLYLLDKHGHRARIDLQEAKLAQREQEQRAP